MKTSDHAASSIGQGSRRRFTGTGLGVLALLSVFALSACYHRAPYREVSPATPEKPAVSQRTPLTQIYFYPKAGQTDEQQSRDHYECYNWAVKQTGFDPGRSAIPLEQRIQVVPLPPPGFETVRMAIAGAVLGALIGGHRHAGGGALIGAAGGAIAGAMSDAARQESARQMEEAYARQDQARNAQLQEQELRFRRAMSACLEGRGYTVK
ncbi:MAG: glycine zipper family protein [Syntrophaceae bacterium]|nr:glycine zipper family protein [Syntrophaceae bacterium]